MVNLRQNTVNASKCQIYDHKIRFMVHILRLTLYHLFPLMKPNHIYCIKLKNGNSLLLALVTKFRLQGACQYKRWTLKRKHVPDSFTAVWVNIYPILCKYLPVRNVGKYLQNCVQYLPKCMCYTWVNNYIGKGFT